MPSRRNTSTKHTNPLLLPLLLQHLPETTTTRNHQTHCSKNTQLQQHTNSKSHSDATNKSPTLQHTTPLEPTNTQQHHRRPISPHNKNIKQQEKRYLEDQNDTAQDRHWICLSMRGRRISNVSSSEYFTLVFSTGSEHKAVNEDISATHFTIIFHGHVSHQFVVWAISHCLTRTCIVHPCTASPSTCVRPLLQPNCAMSMCTGPTRTQCTGLLHGAIFRICLPSLAGDRVELMTLPPRGNCDEPGRIKQPNQFFHNCRTGQSLP